jgi:hypothetical protein
MKRHAQRVTSGNKKNHRPPFTFRHQSSPCRFPLALSPQLKPFRSSWRLPTVCHTRPVRIGSRSPDGCPSVPFIILIKASCLVTALRSSMLFASQVPRTHDTENIHVAHTHPGTGSSLPSQRYSNWQYNTETPPTWTPHECMLSSPSHIIYVIFFASHLPHQYSILYSQGYITI